LGLPMASANHEVPQPSEDAAMSRQHPSTEPGDGAARIQWSTLYWMKCQL
jgi:hypothetical protein